MVRALASQQCGPGSIPGLGVICRLSLLLVLVLALRVFSPGAPLSSKTNTSKFQFDLDYLFILLFIYKWTYKTFSVNFPSPCIFRSFPSWKQVVYRVCVWTEWKMNTLPYIWNLITSIQIDRHVIMSWKATRMQW